MIRVALNGLMCIIVLSLLTSCGGSFRSSKLQRPVLEDTEHIIYKNITLKASVAVINHGMVQEGKIKKVRAQFKNMMSKTINAEIRVKWLDSTGFELTDSQGWFPLILMKGDKSSFERYAPSPNAADYRIIIRLAGSN
ncbi:MAG: YcfL family protein [Calditrichaeota bacterium]|nr:YcfL family protein [Calditrichota bacterium]